MKKTILTKLIALVISGLFLFSCQEEMDQSPQLENQSEQADVAELHSIELEEKPYTFHLPDELGVHDIKVDAVEPGECSSTPFNEVTSYYSGLLNDDFFSLWTGSLNDYFLIFEDYFTINYIAAFLEDKNTDYFGEDGSSTNYVKKRTRNLEKFWDMENLVSVKGQHTETLEDLDFIRYVFENYSTADAATIDLLVSIAEYYNTNGSQIPENPFYASDGFASSNGTIVIGDGIVQMVSEAGFDEKVVWSSILAHEWAHQIQFLNFSNWDDYPVPAFANTPESTRMTELEADFFTGFYLTHKRGGTYNWKRVEDVLGSFFNIGDCGFTSPGHHGTPLERMAAAKAGYDLADSIKKKGHLPTMDEVHEAFLAAYDDILSN